MKEEVMIRLVQLAQVIGVGLERDGVRIEAPRTEPSQQHFSRRLQIDYEIGRRDIPRKQIVQTLIDEQLVVVEIDVRKDLVAIEEIVRDCQLAKQIGLSQRHLLTVTVQQKEQLRLQSGPRPIGVEISQKGIVGF